MNHVKQERETISRKELWAIPEFEHYARRSLYRAYNRMVAQSGGTPGRTSYLRIRDLARLSNLSETYIRSFLVY